MSFVPGSIVQCTTNKGVVLTKGKSYEVVASYDWQVAVVNDHKAPQFYDAARFKLVTAARAPDVDSSALVVLCDATERFIATLRDAGFVVQRPVVEQVERLEQTIAFARS